MDNTLLRNKILDAVYNAREKYMYCVFGFSDESEQSLLHSIIHSIGFTDYMFWGGYTDAERKCLGIFPSVPETEYFPISFIKSLTSMPDCLACLTSKVPFKPFTRFLNSEKKPI